MSNDDAQQWDRVALTLLDVEAPSLAALAGVVATAVGATDCRLLIADYSLRFLRPLESDGSVGEIIPVEGTMAGRCFASGEPVSNGDASPTTWLPLNDSAERIGVAELRFVNAGRPGADANGSWIVGPGDRQSPALHRRDPPGPTGPPVVRSRRGAVGPPPTTHAFGGGAAVPGALEPAYAIGGDSFDYAFNPATLDFAVLDAAGHGLDAVLMCAAAVHSLRNARRSNRSLADTYAQIDRRIRLQFGNSYFVTGQLCSLDVTDGTLTWINAGHVLPLHVRGRTLIGEVDCAASLPMGLGGDVREVAQPSSCSPAIGCSSTPMESPSHARPTASRSVWTGSPTSW